MEKTETLMQIAQAAFKGKLAPDAFEKAKEILGGPIKEVFDAMEKEITDPNDMMCVQSLIILTQMWEALPRLSPGIGKMVVHTSMKHTAQIFVGLTNGDSARVDRLFALCDKYVKQLDSLVAPHAGAVKAAARGEVDYSKL